ncbi:outer envelope pore protein 16, chloroplastic isoform X1 [Coffea arabica]|uniref:Outer envelope pore protein 16, chloroplastic isoform X1 n=1 Tax=Coffea arabica TaxID=13443 RepID=A0A6P6W1K1_COFAR|nr:outer envelope pore protein 16, chloroplastic-like isoform X1 [Coffea arabica]
MPRTRISGTFSSPKVDLIIDTGNPFLNLTVDGFLKIGCVAATKAAAEEAYYIVKRGSISHHKFEDSLKKMCKEGAYWVHIFISLTGTVAGVYVGLEYGVERIRGVRDWKNAMIGGALTGALISAASNKNKDKIVMDAIAGSAIATAAEFINHFT